MKATDLINWRKTSTVLSGNTESVRSDYLENPNRKKYRKQVTEIVDFAEKWLNNLSKMKTLLIIIAILLTNTMLFAQGNFKAENGDAIWQKIYSDINIKRVSELTAQLANVDKTGGIINGTLDDVSVNYDAEGLRRSQIPMFMCYPYKASVLIEAKENRYRVTVRNIQFLAPESVIYNRRKKYTAFSFWAIGRDGALKSSKNANKYISALNADLTDRFKLSDNVDEW